MHSAAPALSPEDRAGVVSLMVFKLSGVRHPLENLLSTMGFIAEKMHTEKTQCMHLCRKMHTERARCKHLFWMKNSCISATAFL